MVHLVALLEPAEDGDRVFHRGLIDEDGLEAALEGRVLLDVLAVLVERGGAHQAQLTAREQRLDHVAGIHRPFGRAGADDGVQLVDEGDHLAVGVGDLLEHGLEALLELAAVLGARDHRAEVEADEALVLQPLGDVALDDAPGQALHDRRLAHARLADQDGVVLRAPGQHLDDPADLVVPADDGIELALAGRLGEVPAVLLERLELLLGVLAGDAVAASHLAERSEEVLTADVELVGEREQQVLGRQVLVAHLPAGPVAAVEGLLEGPREADVAPVGLREARDRVVGRVAHGQRLLARPREDRQHHAFLLAEERGEQVVVRDLGVAVRGPPRWPG